MQALATTLDQIMKQWVGSQESTIKPVLSKMGNDKWRVTLTEIWPEGSDAIWRGSSGLDERVEWTYQTLRTWDTAHRSAWDEWNFDTRYEAEKFITLFTLKWAR